jgi:hypothetical protein
VDDRLEKGTLSEEALVILQVLLAWAVLLVPSTALAAGPAVRVDDPDDVTGRRLLDIKSATNQAEDWGGTLENGMFSIQAFEPIGQGNFLTRRGADPYATIRIIVRYTKVHPGLDYIFTLRWDEEFDADWRGEDLVTGDVTGIAGGVFTPTPDTLAFFYEAGIIPVDGISGFSWATQYVRLNRETGEVRGVIDRAPDQGFASQGAS